MVDIENDVCSQARSFFFFYILQNSSPAKDLEGYILFYKRDSS